MGFRTLVRYREAEKRSILLSTVGNGGKAKVRSQIRGYGSREREFSFRRTVGKASAGAHHSGNLIARGWARRMAAMAASESKKLSLQDGTNRCKDTQSRTRSLPRHGISTWTTDSRASTLHREHGRALPGGRNLEGTLALHGIPGGKQ
jgi:hypothetical protein